MNHDVLIVGAGPTGLMLAALLSRWGIIPRIIDQADGPSPFSRATGVQARSLEILRQLGLDQQAVADGLPAAAVNLFAGSNRMGRVPFAELGHEVTPYPYLLVLPQDRTEAIIGADLARHRVSVDWRTRLEHLRQTSDGVEATITDDQGTRSVTTRYLVGTDGARSTVRQQLDVTFDGDTYGHRFFVADLRIDGLPAEDELNIMLSNRFKFMAMFPMRGTRRFRLVGIVPDEYAHLTDPTFDDLRNYFAERMGDILRLSDVQWFATYRVHHRVASRFRVGSVLLAGDSAHVHSPVGGQGMNTGLQDAHNLAWKLALTIGGRVGDHLLDTYHEERHPNAVRLVRTTDRVFSTFIASTTGLSSLLRSHVLPAVLPRALRRRHIQRRLFATLSQTDINYRRSSLSWDKLHGRRRAGDRFPAFAVFGGNSLDLLSPNRFTAIPVGRPPERDLDPDLGERVEVTPTITRHDGHDAGLAEGIYLVRPDGYIAATTTSLIDVATYLRQVIATNTPLPVTPLTSEPGTQQGRTPSSSP